jgi:protein phosphatase 1L
MAYKSYGAAASQGRREFMEDVHSVTHVPWGPAKTSLPCSDFSMSHRLFLPGQDGAWGQDGAAWASVFALFDGHGGRKCSAYCADVIVPHILAAAQREPSTPAALKAAFLSTDSAFLAAYDDGLEGSTALVALMIDQDHAWVANLGDSRAVLVAQGGGAAALSVDHKPTLPDERARIEASGGFVYRARANGVLAVSRAMGNRHLKQFGVSSAPDVVRVDTRSSVAIILATDGLWDVVSNEDAGELCAHIAQTVGGATWPQVAADSLVSLALDRGSSDNVSVIIISTAAAPAAAAAAEEVALAAPLAAAAAEEEDEEQEQQEQQDEEKEDDLLLQAEVPRRFTVPTTTYVKGDTPEDGLMITRTRKFVSGDWTVKPECAVHGSCMYGQMCRSAKCTRAHYATLGRARWAARWRGGELQFLQLRDGGLEHHNMTKFFT